jgi:hypothetical protein
VPDVVAEALEEKFRARQLDPEAAGVLRPANGGL